MAEFKKTEVIPLRDQLVVQLVQKRVMHGKILVVHQTNEEEHIGKILLLGEEIKNKKLQPEQYVMFEKWAGREIGIDGKKCRLIEETHLIAVLNVEKKYFEEEK